jgi:hypothetical protein
MWDKLRSLFGAGETSPATADPGYALAQLLRAQEASTVHEDPEIRERARRKVEEWTAILQGMLSGDLAIGSRTPVAGTPGWVTLQVVSGGFATGRPMAGGPFLSHELELAARLGLPAEETSRGALNDYFLRGPGHAELRGMLHSGCYRIGVPEEGALLVLAWLIEREDTEAATALLEAIAPWLGRLRFYPLPDDRPLTASADVRVQPVHRTVQSFKAIPEASAALVQREALTVWAPLFDRIAALFLETVKDGWPCQIYLEGWRERAQAWLDDFAKLRARHQRSRRPDQPKGGFAILRASLERCVADPASLTGREVGRVLTGTLYETYYGISYARDLRITEPAASGGRPPVAPGFSSLCLVRAGHPPEGRGSRWVARNGMIIEQEQILTTHNLAALVAGLALLPELAPQLDSLARRCFAWICQQQRIGALTGPARLRGVKNAAYAWRQMIFFLSLAPAAAVEDFLVWAGEHLAKQSPAFQERFRPALDGLARAARGASLDTPEEVSSARRFLGWTVGKHWLFAGES